MAGYNVYENGIDIPDEFYDCVLMGIQLVGLKTYLKDKINVSKIEEKKRLENMTVGERAQYSLQSFYKRNKR